MTECNDLLSPETIKEIESDTPYPIAIAFKKFRDIHPDRYTDKIDALLKLFEIIVKLLTVICVKSLLLEGAPTENFRSQLKDLRRATLGHWVGLLSNSIAPFKKLPPSLLIQEIMEWYNIYRGGDENVKEAVEYICSVLTVDHPSGKLTTRSLVDVVLYYRNKGIGHGSRVSDEEYRQRLKYLGILVVTLLRGLNFFKSFPICYVEEVKVKAGEYYCTLRVGKGKELELLDVHSSEALQDMRLYIFSFGPEGEPVFALDLSPYVIMRHCPSCKTDQFFFFNSMRKRALEYLSYSCGHTLLVDDPTGEFENIEQFLSGKISLDTLFHGKTLGYKLSEKFSAVTKENRLKAAHIVQQSIDFIKSDLSSEALKLIRNASILDPDSSDVYFYMGICLILEKGSLEDVIEAFKEASRLNPNFARAKYAVGETALILGKQLTAKAAFKDVVKLDPANELYRKKLNSLPDLLSENEDSSTFELTVDSEIKLEVLVKDLMSEGEDVLPRIHWWLTAIPPWSWINKRPLMGSLIITSALLLGVILSDPTFLNFLTILWMINISILSFLGLYAPFKFPGFINRAYQSLRTVVILPPDSFKRWFLSELKPFSGSYHSIEPKTAYTIKSVFKNDSFHAWGFIVSFICFSIFQTSCALAMDNLTAHPSTWIRFFFYYFEVFVLSWIPTFVIRALQFIPGFVNLPIRYFIGMPDSVSLKPLGTLYLKFASLGSLAFLFFTTQHYLYRTHLVVPLASVGFIIVVYILFFTVMFASQGLITLSLERLKQKRLLVYSYHMEEVFNEFMEEPNETNFKNMINFKNYLKFLQKKLNISGFTKLSFILFLLLSFIEIAVIIIYYYLVLNSIWIYPHTLKSLF